jgi:hypothetical protein
VDEERTVEDERLAGSTFKHRAAKVVGKRAMNMESRRDIKDEKAYALYKDHELQLLMLRCDHACKKTPVRSDGKCCRCAKLPRDRCDLCSGEGGLELGPARQRSWYRVAPKWLGVTLVFGLGVALAFFSGNPGVFALLFVVGAVLYGVARGLRWLLAYPSRVARRRRVIEILRGELRSDGIETPKIRPSRRLRRTRLYIRRHWPMLTWLMALTVFVVARMPSSAPLETTEKVIRGAGEVVSPSPEVGGASGGDGEGSPKDRQTPQTPAERKSTVLEPEQSGPPSVVPNQPPAPRTVETGKNQGSKARRRPSVSCSTPAVGALALDRQTGVAIGEIVGIDNKGERCLYVVKKPDGSMAVHGPEHVTVTSAR